MSFNWGLGDEIIPQSQERRGRLDRRTQRWRQRLERSAASRATPRTLAKAQDRFSPKPPRKTQPCPRLDLGLLASATVKTRISAASAAGLVVLITAALGN